MNLAEATSALSKKEVEKTAVLEEIEKLTNLRDTGAVAVLHATVYGIAYASHDDSEVVFSYKLIEEGEVDPIAIAVDQVIDDSIRFNLPSKTGKLVISARFAAQITDELDPEAEPVVKIFKYRTEIGVAEIPEDGELRTDLSAEEVEGDVSNTISFKFKASVDDVMTELAHREQALLELEEEFLAIVAAVQDAKKRQSAAATKSAAAKKEAKEAKKKDNKKVSRSSSSDSVGTSRAGSTAGTAPADDAAEGGPSYLEQATSSVVAAGAFVLGNYPYFLFGVSAVVIHLYGDHVSV